MEELISGVVAILFSFYSYTIAKGKNQKYKKIIKNVKLDKGIGYSISALLFVCGILLIIMGIFW
jgi:hypothetical protein